MKKMILVATLLAASTAMAGELKFDFRTDLESYSSNDQTGKPSYSKFYLQTARLDYNGKLAENTSFRARLRLNKDLEVATTKRDSVNNTVDFFMAKTALNESTQLYVGKFQGLPGGWENLVAGSDTYLKSKALGELSKVAYYTGAGLDYKINEEQVLKLHVANQDTDEVDGSNNLKQTKNMLAVGWEGNFFEGNLKPLITYTNSPKAGSDLANTYISAGLKCKTEAWLTDVEYLQNTWAEKSAVDIDDVTESLTLAVAHKGEFWTPRAKVDLTTFKSDGTKTADAMSVALIAEYKPVADQELRYHIVAIQTSTTPKGGASATEQFLVAGLKLNADFLK